MSNPFPTRLHDMLDEAEEKGHDHIVSWNPDGKSFKIHDPVSIVSILQKYFQQNKFQSFQRQLHGYDFHRHNYGVEKGKMSHPFFQRGMRKLASFIKRRRGIKKSSSAMLNAEIPTDISVDCKAISTTPLIETTLPPSNDSNRLSHVVGSFESSRDRLEAIMNRKSSTAIDTRFHSSTFLNQSADTYNSARAENHLMRRQTQRPQFLADEMTTLPLCNAIARSEPFAALSNLPQTKAFDPLMLPVLLLERRTKRIEALKAEYVLEAQLEIERVLRRKQYETDSNLTAAYALNNHFGF
mmetsp:Transcript_3486/g.8410  ORF Transcript_3486/g.8410 Transcript_3486/m.8410 type:complete len:297 (-) Transcript_3486:612-1502(-)